MSKELIARLRNGSGYSDTLLLETAADALEAAERLNEVLTLDAMEQRSRRMEAERKLEIARIAMRDSASAIQNKQYAVALAHLDMAVDKLRGPDAS